MSFSQNLFKPVTPVVPSVDVTPVPSLLPKITAPTAAIVCMEYEPAPPAKQLLTPQQTPPQFFDLLEKNHISEEEVNFLAYGLPERESVWWATQCAQKVSNPINVTDHAAVKAAEDWVKAPSELTQKAAADAAAKTDFQTPGAWAAQAAAWSTLPPSATPARTYDWTQDAKVFSMPTASPENASEETANPRLTPKAVVGAVMLAMAVKANKISAVPKAEVPKMGVPNAKAEASKLAASGLEKAGVPASPGGAGTGLPGNGLSKLAAPGAGLSGADAASLVASAAAPLAGGAVSGIPGASVLANAGGVADQAKAVSSAASGLSPQGAADAALSAAKSEAAKLNPSSLSPADLARPDQEVKEMVKKELSPQERKEMSLLAEPFIKLGIDIASGAVSLS
jgi:hypothetical protein